MSINNLLNSIQKTPMLPQGVATKIAVLYSRSQKCFHIETVGEYISENLKLSVLGGNGDYRMLGIAETDEDAHNLIEEIRAGFTFLNYNP